MILISASGWSVSTTALPDGTTRLNVARHPFIGVDHRRAPGDLDGRTYATPQAATSAALAHGYTRPYTNPRAAAKRVHAAFLAAERRALRAALLRAPGRGEVGNYVAAYAGRVAARLRDPQARVYYAAGYWLMARALRPALFINRPRRAA